MTDYDAVAHVTSSGYRQQVLEQLAEDVKTPSEIADATDIEVSHVSRTLGELREYNLVELIVDEDRRKGRYYQITEKGDDVWSVAKARA